jgi:hypothetical protein
MIILLIVLKIFMISFHFLNEVHYMFMLILQVYPLKKFTLVLKLIRLSLLLEQIKEMIVHISEFYIINM